jgi:hypothetical protein
VVTLQISRTELDQSIRVKNLLEVAGISRNVLVPACGCLVLADYTQAQLQAMGNGYMPSQSNLPRWAPGRWLGPCACRDACTRR